MTATIDTVSIEQLVAYNPVQTASMEFKTWLFDIYDPSEFGIDIYDIENRVLSELDEQDVCSEFFYDAVWSELEDVTIEVDLYTREFAEFLQAEYSGYHDHFYAGIGFDIVYLSDDGLTEVVATDYTREQAPRSVLAGQWLETGDPDDSYGADRIDAMLDHVHAWSSLPFVD